MLIHYQDNGAIKCGLVTTAQFGREEAGRLSQPSHDDPHEKDNLYVHTTVTVNEAQPPELDRKETAA
jgi:hypothetical protein